MNVGVPIHFPIQISSECTFKGFVEMHCSTLNATLAKGRAPELQTAFNLPG